MNGMLLKLELAKPATYNEIQILLTGCEEPALMQACSMGTSSSCSWLLCWCCDSLQWWVLLEVGQLFLNMCKIGQSKPIYDAYWIKFVLLVGWVEQDKVCLKVDRLGTGLLGRPKIFSHTLMWLVMYGHVMALKLCQSYRHTCVYGAIWGNLDKN